MKHGKTTVTMARGAFTRRRLIKVFTAVGLAASPFMSRLTAARESGDHDNTRMLAAIFFESHKASSSRPMRSA